MTEYKSASTVAHASNTDFDEPMAVLPRREETNIRARFRAICLIWLICMSSRYAMNEMYTLTGSIHLALNPFNAVKCILMAMISWNDCDGGQAIFAGAISKKNTDGAILLPREYAVVDNADRVMLWALEDNSGKTDLDGSADACADNLWE